MMSSLRLASLISVCGVVAVWGYGGGAPCQAQHSLQPNSLYHGAGIKSVSPPYKFSVLGKRGRQIKRYRPGETYTVRISGGAHFRGFLVQARLATKKGEIIGHLRAGRFVEDQRNWTAQGIKIQKCPPVFANAITHTNNDKKYEIDVKWTVTNNVGPVQFYVTVVQEKTVFWSKWKPRTGFLLPTRRRPKTGSPVRKPRPPPQEEIEEVPSEVLQKPQPGSLERPTSAKESEALIEKADLRHLSRRISQAKESGLGGFFGRGTTDSREASAPKTREPPPRPPTHPPPPPPPPPPPIPSQASSEEDAPQLFGLRRLALPEQTKVELLKREDFCKSDPCFNGGTCVNLDDEEGFICFCKDKYTGEFCETVNHCHRHECVYGVCQNEEDGYKCECHDEYLGVHCERHCPSYLCEHGGTCFVDETGGYGCKCTTGWTGEQCHVSIDDCEGHGCLNGAECVDGLNGYSCKCTEGYMGQFCHRPCQNIYKSCETWEAENRCDAMRTVTKFFDINCAATCGQCIMDNETIFTDVPTPPILEPFQFLIGDWVANYSSYHRYPIDFDSASGSYSDLISFHITQAPMFGTPSINFSSLAVSNSDPGDVMQNHGFLTLNTRGKPGEPADVALVSTGSDGVTIIEEGKLDGTEMNLKVQYVAMLPQVETLAYDSLERTLTLRTPYLRETVTKTKPNGSKQYYTKYYYQLAPIRAL